MQRLNSWRAIFIALVAIGAQAKWLFGIEAAGQVAGARSIPVFGVAAGWPKVPPRSRAGACRS
jgi:hypothetical protein